MRFAAIILALFGVIFLAAAAAVGGGMAAVNDSGWLLPGGLACLGLAWILTIIPA